MAVSDDKKPVLSPALEQFLRRRVMEMVGLALVIAGVASCVALWLVLVRMTRHLTGCQTRRC